MKTAAMKVELIEHMGSDLSVTDAARVSFAKKSNWDWVDDAIGGHPVLSVNDARLINYLAREGHFTPFCHPHLTLRIKAPLFVARQLVKHQVGGVWSEVSRRYVSDEPEFWFPEVWRGRPQGSIKQGSSGVVELATRSWADGEDKFLPMTPHELCADALSVYNAMLAQGVAPEQARMILPQNMHTEWVWTGSLMFFVRVCKLRLDQHAQAETRKIAEQIAEIVAPLFPVSWSALMEN